MISALKNLINPQQPRATGRVVDGKLILSFPYAVTPIVWQMDLSQVKASALEVIAGEKGNYDALSLKTPKGEKLEIAQFETRDEAVNGLMAAASALENGHGCIQGTSQSAAQSNTPRAANTNTNTNGKWLVGALSVLLLFVLFGVWSSIAPQTPQSFNTGSISPTASPQNTRGAAPASTAAGVPVSADDFLNGL